MEISNWIQIIGLFVAVITIVLAILEFRRNKRIELQNIVYKFKLDCFSNLVGKLDEILDLYSLLINEIEDVIESGYKELSEEVNEIQKKSEKIISQHCTEIMKYSVAFPEKIVNECAAFINNQYGEYDQSENINIELKNFRKFYTEQLNHADVIYKLVREDLGLEKVNKRLYDRS